MRMYELNGREYPSVTTIIHMISLDDGLMKWANWMGFKRKDLKSLQDESTSFGTLIHEYLRAEVDSRYPKRIPYNVFEAKRITDVLDNFRPKYQKSKIKTVDTELTIISPHLGFGGTLDWLGKRSDSMILSDFKTSKAVYSTMFLQLGAYSLLLKQEKNITVDEANIIIANAKKCGFYPINRVTIDLYEELFLSLFQFYSKWTATKMRSVPEAEF